MIGHWDLIDDQPPATKKPKESLISKGSAKAKTEDAEEALGASLTANAKRSHDDLYAKDSISNDEVINFNDEEEDGLDDGDAPASLTDVAGTVGEVPLKQKNPASEIAKAKGMLVDAIFNHMEELSGSGLVLFLDNGKFYFSKSILCKKCNKQIVKEELF